MFRLLAALLALSFVLLAGCTAGGSSSESGGPSKGAEGSGLPEQATPEQVTKFVADKMSGKKVIYLASATGIPNVDEWANTFETAFKQLGVDYQHFDAQSSPQRQVQNLQTAINQHPDVIIVHNLDLTNEAGLIKKAQDEGIFVVVITLGSVAQSDAFVGGNYAAAATTLGQRVVDDCRAKGKKDVAILTGFTGDALSVQAEQIWKHFFKSKGLNVVSSQATNFDPTKANSIAKTVMQQDADLCGFVGVWDLMTVGAGQAVKSVGKTGEVGVYTLDASTVGCQGLQDGTITAAVDYGWGELAPMAVGAVEYLLQSGVQPGTHRTAILTRYVLIDKTNMSHFRGSCYTGSGF